MRKQAATWVIATAFLMAAVAEAQQPAKLSRLGLLIPGLGSSNPRATHSCMLSKNWAMPKARTSSLNSALQEGQQDRIQKLAAELVTLKVNAIVAFSHVVALSVKKATTEIPIIFVGVSSDPVGMGLVRSLARPGGNITGVSLQGLELIGKRLELKLPHTKTHF
jgi:putative ABC transport system substrate-binding protein